MWRWTRDPPWGRGPPPQLGVSPEPLEICLALSRHLFDLCALSCLGAARSLLRLLRVGRLLAALGLGGAGGAWLQGVFAFLLAAQGLRLLLRLLLGQLPALALLYAALQGLVLAASLRPGPLPLPDPPPPPPPPPGTEPRPPGEEDPRGPPDGREPAPERRGAAGASPAEGWDPSPDWEDPQTLWWDPPSERWEPPGCKPGEEGAAGRPPKD